MRYSLSVSINVSMFKANKIIACFNFNLSVNRPSVQYISLVSKSSCIPIVGCLRLEGLWCHCIKVHTSY